MTRPPTYRSATPDDLPAVAAFVQRVYGIAIAPAELPEGQATFARYADAAAMAARTANHGVWVAEAGGALVGALEVRDGTHLALLFVEPAWQRSGVGRGLLAAAFGAPAAWPALTVNSTPDAVGAYARLGFVAQGPVEERHGIRSVPMRREGGQSG